jgi:signal transduction histidine kinase
MTNPNSPIKILLVDDQITHIDHIAQMLNENGYETCIAQTYHDALDAAAQFKPHVILLDHGLGTQGTITGANLLLTWRRTPRMDHVKIIALTSNANVRDELIAYGVNEFILKTSGTDYMPEVLEKIGRVLHGESLTIDDSEKIRFTQQLTGKLVHQVNEYRLKWDEQAQNFSQLQEDVIALNQLIAVNAAVSALIHKIYSPLQAAHSSIDAALVDYQAGYDPTLPLNDALEAIQQIRESLDKLNREQSGGYAAQKWETVNLNDCIRVALDTVKQKRTTIVREIKFTESRNQKSIPVWIIPSLIIALFEVLLQNAVDASPIAGEIKIFVEVEERRVIVSISDQGQGVPNEDIGKLFKLFYTTKPTGHGMGLAIAKLTTQLHLGTITYRHNVPHGAIFTVELPLKPLPTPSPSN